MADNENVIPIRRHEPSKSFLALKEPIRNLARLVDLTLQVAIIEREIGEAISEHGSCQEWLLEQCQQLAGQLAKQYDGDGPSAAS